MLAAANKLFYNEGVHTVIIDRIIEQADVAKASLYSTFGSKDELVRPTCRPGVFAVGDVRSGSVKRVAAAIGEGSVAVRLAFERLQSAGTADPASLAAR